MQIDLKSRPTLKQIAAADEVLGTPDQIKSSFLTAVQFATKAKGPVHEQAEQAALKLLQGLSPARALVVSEKSVAELQKAGFVATPATVDLLNLCKRDSLERWKELKAHSASMQRAPQGLTNFGEKLSQAISARQV
ncbi:MAG: hypothetical protein PW734_02055 [Verrucomicrobium sp.]|nr:hypothetical protein [Verrucomicrobium sp.]